MVFTSIFKKLAIVGLLATAAALSDASGAIQVGTHESFTLDAKAGASRQDVISYPGASYIAVHFSEFNLAEGDVVVVRSPDGSTSYEYTKLGRADRGKSGGFHASFIPGGKAVIEYRATSTDASGEFGYKIDSFARGITNDFQESICGKDNSKPSKCFISGSDANGVPLAYTRSNAVARLLIGGDSMCTGWLVGSEGHLITNHHCITQASDADQIDFDFTAEGKDCNDRCEKQMGCPGTVVAKKATFIANHKEHDWALVKLEGLDVTKYGYLQLRSHGPALGEQIYIPQHPLGWAKRIASVLDDGSFARVTNLTAISSCGSEQVGYMADTQGGSSGSPVISADDNTVVALHHCGGCENTAINVEKLLADFKDSGISFKNMVAGGAGQPTSAPQPTPAPKPAPTPATPKPTPEPPVITPTAKPWPTRTSRPTKAPTPPASLCVGLTKKLCKRMPQCQWVKVDLEGQCVDRAW